ncbi:MAG: hypothetical protein RBS40_06620, partial [Rhodocyclaceae bacterium]|nr:hypothetical protein [Rhodocyclaceae bacterium]
MTTNDLSALVAQISAKLRELAAPWAAGDPSFADPRRLALAERADPYTGLTTQVGAWPRDSLGRRGEVTINDDGSFFAEYDVLAWQGDRFVEAVTAWGRPGKLRGEARLL